MFDNIIFKELLKTFSNQVDWDYISQHEILSEEFIREFANYLNWHHISKYQKLSYKFIKEFSNKVNWDHIYKWQKLPKSQLTEHYEYLFGEDDFKLKEFIKYCKANNWSNENNWSWISE